MQNNFLGRIVYDLPISNDRAENAEWYIIQLNFFTFDAAYMNHFFQTESIIHRLFGEGVELLPNISELFELEMAFLEYSALPKEQVLEKSAYIKSINNRSSNHYLLYSQQPSTIHEDRSAQTQAYFDEGQYSTGYATHGLFPYRGKFHPQLIKGLINILGITKNDVILDPMAGSGTTNIEAALMGIDSLAADVSPFCQFMIRTKWEALSIDSNLLSVIDLNDTKLFAFFAQGNVQKRLEQISDTEKLKIYHLAFLAYLDALGYSKRVKTSNHEQLFKKVLRRYVETVQLFLKNPYFDRNSVGIVNILTESNALDMRLESQSVDCIITSPPYSFAIDYVENDKDQLEFLGYDTDILRNSLIGLKGKTKKDKLENYFTDMDIFCKEASQVLKINKYLVVIIGSNTVQTGGIRLEESIITSAEKYNLKLVKSILKPIRGMRSTMKSEYILIFQKNAAAESSLILPDSRGRVNVEKC